MKLKKSYLKIGLLSMSIFLVLTITLLNSSVQKIKNMNTVTGQVVNNQKVSFLDKILVNDPAYNKIGSIIEENIIEDAFSGREVDLKTAENELIIVESFYTGCVSCLRGIRFFNSLYDQYNTPENERLLVVYLNINPSDTIEDINEIKAAYDGGDWIWAVNANQKTRDVLDSLDITGTDFTYIIKNGEIIYGDSLTGFEEIIQEKIDEVL